MPAGRQHRAPVRPRVAIPWIEALSDPPQPHVVYSLNGLTPGVDPYEVDSAHIYVGVTSNLRERLYAHSRKWWFVAVVPELCEFDPHATRAAAEKTEAALIRFLQPAMNRAGRLLVVESR